MKRQVLILIGLIILILMLIGCSEIAPVFNQKEEIKEVINNFWVAISNNQYELAKSLCVKNGIAYNTAIGYQNSFNAGTLPEINLIPNINWICIVDNKAVVNLDIETITSFSIVITENLELDLIKIVKFWKLK
jgi:PBP1b-binding outer membrane lipoprotein LpoB